MGVLSCRAAVAFVQPGLGSIAPAPAANVHGAMESRSVDEISSSGKEFEAKNDAVRCLLGSLLLGLMLGFSGLAAPASADDAPLPKMCIRTEGCIGPIEDAWNKAKFKELDVEQTANKYTISSTGAGRYKLFGLDYASPVSTIPETTDGTYPLKYTGKIFGPLGKQISYEQGYSAAGSKSQLYGKDQEDKAFLERVKPLLGKNATITPTYSPFAPFDWGKTAWEMEGTKINSGS